MSNRARRTFAALLLWLACLPAMAQTADDPPARVGRLAVVENDVNFLVDRNDQGSPAAINWPLSSGAILDSGRPGRAESWIGSTAYRLADDSRLEFTTVDDRQVDLNVDRGSLTVSILDPNQADDVTVYTPEGRIRFAAPGRYRIDVRPGRTELTAQAGRASLDNRAQSVQIVAGQKASLRDNGQLAVDADYDHDAFDQWVAARENATTADTARRHVSPDMTGYQDLDAYGDWRTAPDYGSVWYPRSLADDWAPYRFGRWAWIAPWGWTWIDQSPWGFAPFHYGRWVLIQGRWAWAPGRVARRPVYAPALVGWIGNPGWSVGFSSGAAPAVGWFPLAPHEVYVPAHRHSPDYVHRVNVNHVHNVTVIDRARRGDHRPTFAHRDTSRAVTVVPAGVVRDGRTIGRTDLHRTGGDRLEGAPRAGHAPDAGWLRPGSGASRPHGDDRRAPPPRRGDREADSPARPGAATSPRPTAVPERNPAVAPTNGDREQPPRRGSREADNPARPETATSPRPTATPERNPAVAPTDRDREQPPRRGSREADSPVRPEAATSPRPTAVPERSPVVAPTDRDREQPPRPASGPQPRRPAADDGDDQPPPRGDRREPPATRAPESAPVPARPERSLPVNTNPRPEPREVFRPNQAPEVRREADDADRRPPQRSEPPRPHPRDNAATPPRHRDIEPPLVRPAVRAPQAEPRPFREPRAAPQPEPRRSEPRQRERDDGKRHEGGERGR